MNSSLTAVTTAPAAAAQAPRQLPSTIAPFASFGLRVADIAILPIAGAVGFAMLNGYGLTLQSDEGYYLLVAALFAPFVMDKLGGYATDRLHRLGHLGGSAAFGCAILFGALLAVSLSLDVIDHRMGIWFAAWGLLSVCGMIAVRGALATITQSLIVSGRLRETIAIVGTDADSLRLAGQLGRDASQSLEIVGVFGAGETVTDARLAGSLGDLIKLGQVRRIDKVIVAAPISGQPEVHRVIHALKSLAVDVLLAPHGAGGEPLVRVVDRVGELAVIRIASSRRAAVNVPTAQAA